MAPTQSVHVLDVIFGDSNVEGAEQPSQEVFVWLWGDPRWQWIVTAFAQAGTEGCQQVGHGTWRFLLALFLPFSGSEALQVHGKIVFLSELIRSEARVVVSIGELKGLPNPEAFQQLEVGSEGPVISYSYYVTYEFGKGEELEDRGSPEVGD